MHDEITQAIVRTIAASHTLSRDPASLGDHDDLYAAGLKSLAAVQLMLALEAEFRIEFPDSVLHRSAFSTIGRIRDTVAGLLDQPEAMHAG